MANTYDLIASTTLNSNASSITFSSIPQTYTDLVIRTTVRNSITSGSQPYFAWQFNTDTGANYGTTAFLGLGASGVNGFTDPFTNPQSGSYNKIGFVNDGTFSASTFGISEFYIFNYTSTAQYKQISVMGGQAANSTTSPYTGIWAGLWNGSAAITSIKLMVYVDQNFVSGSSFYLYGIKNT